MSDAAPVRSQLVDYANRLVTFRELGKKAMRKISAESPDGVMEILVAGANDIRNEAILGMRNSPATGNLYFRYWKTRKGKRRELKSGFIGPMTGREAVFHRASQPGFPPRPDTGSLLRSIIIDARFTEVEVGSIITNPAYPKWLEEGTKNMEARPWLFPAAVPNVKRIDAAVTRMLRGIAEDLARSGP